MIVTSFPCGLSLEPSVPQAVWPCDTALPCQLPSGLGDAGGLSDAECRPQTPRALGRKAASSLRCVWALGQGSVSPCPAAGTEVRTDLPGSQLPRLLRAPARVTDVGDARVRAAQEILRTSAVRCPVPAPHLCRPPVRSPSQVGEAGRKGTEGDPAPPPPARGPDWGIRPWADATTAGSVPGAVTAD